MIAMKIKPLNRLIKQYIEPSLPSYHIYQDLVYRVDDDFLLKGYCFDSRQYDKYAIDVSYFIQPLFVKADFIKLTIGNRLSYKKRINFFQTKVFDLWDVSTEHQEESMRNILNSILHQGEKYLNAIQTVRSFYENYFSQRKDHISIHEYISYCPIILGMDFEFQDRSLKKFINFCDAQIEDEYDKVEVEKRDSALILLNERSTESRLKILKTWTNETITCLNLPHISPFDRSS